MYIRIEKYSTMRKFKIACTKIVLQRRTIQVSKRQRREGLRIETADFDGLEWRLKEVKITDELRNLLFSV